VLLVRQRIVAVIDMASTLLQVNVAGVRNGNAAAYQRQR
jgi:hypothetical protein